MFLPGTCVLTLLEQCNDKLCLVFRSSWSDAKNISVLCYGRHGYTPIGATQRQPLSCAHIQLEQSNDKLRLMFRSNWINATKSSVLCSDPIGATQQNNELCPLLRSTKPVSCRDLTSLPYVQIQQALCCAADPIGATQ